MTNSDPAMNPDGGAVDWRCVIQPALEINLMERIVKSQNVYQAWVRVRSNKGVPGIDGMRIEDFADYARREWVMIRQSLLDGSYQPTAVRRVSIPKPGGGERNLGVPCVLDRVIQQAILQVLTPLVDPEFSESSFDSRPKRSAHGAITQVQGFIKAGYRIAVDLDLEKFFDNVQYDVLMSRIARKVKDLISCTLLQNQTFDGALRRQMFDSSRGRAVRTPLVQDVRDPILLKLIGRYLRAGVMIDGTIEATEMGHRKAPRYPRCLPIYC